MRVERGSGLLTGLLLLACAGAGGLVALGWFNSPAPEPIEPAAVKPAALPPEQPVDLSVLETTPFAAHAEVVDRTLFRVERRPQEDEETPEVVVEASAPPADPPPYKLLGVVTTPKKRVALLQPLKGGDVQRVPIGGRVDNWKVASIEANTVIFSAGPRKETLEIDRTPGPVRKALPKKAAKGKKAGAEKGKKQAASPRAALEKQREANREARRKRREKALAESGGLMPSKEQDR